MAAVKTGTDPKRRADFLDSMEEEMRRVSEHLERRERRLGLKSRRSTAGEIANGYSSFSEGSGAEAGARRRRVNPYPRQLRTSEGERTWSGGSDNRTPSPGPRSAPPDSSPPQPFLSQQLPGSPASASPENTTSRRSADRRRQWPGRDAFSAASVRPTNVTSGNRAGRAASSSPLRSPPPVAPKPSSRRSPAPSLAKGPHRPRAGSAPPSHRPPQRREKREAANEEVRSEKESSEEPVEEEEASMAEAAELLENEPTPVPNELSEQPISPSLTPEPSEPLLVVQQSTREGTPESSCSTLSPCPSTPSSCQEVGEMRLKEAASPGIIEITGSFSFKRRTLERHGDETESREGGLERVEEEEEEVESALLEAMMDREGEDVERKSDGEREISTEPEPEIEEEAHREKTSSSDTEAAEQTVKSSVSSDPQGLEVKTLPLSLSGGGGGSRVSPAQQRRGQELDLLVRELQLQLREKDEELGRQRRAAERAAREREEEVARLVREGQKLEREKWELLKRARDGAERVLHLRTQLDLKETQLRSAQTDLGRTRDEMMSVKSANTSLRALLSELRAPKATRDVSVQASLDSATLRRNNSMELAVQDLSRPTSGALVRGIDFRASTTNLDRGANHRISNCSAMSDGWPLTQVPWERDRFEREQSVTSISSAQFDQESREGTPSLSPHSGRKSKKKKTALFGKLRKSTGKRGSTPTIIGEWLPEQQQSVRE